MVIDPKDDLIRLFPKLASCPEFEITSLKDRRYNCIAWAVTETSVWWEPDPGNDFYWPSDVPRTYELRSYERAYETLGYYKCDGAEYEKGFTKIAVFATGGVPTHACRMIGDGIWSSKLGELEDIRHTLQSVNCDDYGEPVLFMKKAE